MPQSLHLRPYQLTGVDSALDAIRSDRPTMYVAPTGTGKSYIQINIHKRLKQRGVILTPSVEIIRGLVAKLGKPDASLVKAEAMGVYTPVRFRNRLLTGAAAKPAYLIIDEAHHDAADTYQEIYEMAGCPRVGFTATNYRGTPQQTAKFLASWARVETLLTWEQAAAGGFITIPEFHTVPLVDDDLIEIKGGELFVSSLESATAGKFHDLTRSLASFKVFDRTRPAVITMPGVGVAKDYHNWCQNAARATALITAETSDAKRRPILAGMVKKLWALIQVRTLGEGADYPIRILADVAPTLSPVKWVQLFGRACRPVGKREAPPVYIAFNRNIQHHGYTIRDILPPSALRESQDAFGGQSVRAVYRMAGIEGFGRVKPTEVRTQAGEFVHLYLMQAVTDAGKVQWGCLLCPSECDPYWFRRELPGGKWKQSTKPTELTATQSVPNYAITQPMLNWWERKAGWFGLDREQPLDGRTFQLLPILSDTNLRLR